jgi:hypothetical protein
MDNPVTSCLNRDVGLTFSLRFQRLTPTQPDIQFLEICKIKIPVDVQTPNQHHLIANSLKKNMTSSVSNPRSVDNALVEVQNSRIDRSGKGLFTKRTFVEGEEIWSQKRPLIATLDHLSLSVVCSNCFAQERDVTRGWRSNDTPVVVKACTQCKLLGFCSKVC